MTHTYTSLMAARITWVTTLGARRRACILAPRHQRRRSVVTASASAFGNAAFTPRAANIRASRVLISEGRNFADESFGGENTQTKNRGETGASTESAPIPCAPDLCRDDRRPVPDACQSRVPGYRPPI